MKIILHVATETAEDLEEAGSYVHSLKGTIERRQGQDMPGALLNHGEATIWVTDAEILLDTVPDKA